MNLWRQLLLVSLLTLVLPWAGCQFVRETETALRSSQEQMLDGTAKAIADSLSQFHFEFSANGTGTSPIYGHPLENAPLIDGYANDWTIADGAMVSLRGTDGAIHYVAGVNGQHWYFYVEVRDSTVVYTTSQNIQPPRNYDSVELTSTDANSERSVFRFSAEAPGAVVATRQTGNAILDEPRIVAHWQDTASGYQLEFRVPRSIVGPRLGLSINNTDDTSRPGVRSASFSGSEPGRAITVSPVLQSVARGYSQPKSGLRLIITNHDGWRIAQSGELTERRTNGNEQSVASVWLQRFYNLLVEPGAQAALAEPAPAGREQQSYISEALGGTPSSNWFRSEETGRAVVSVAHPIWSGTVQTGAIVLQQGTDAVLSLTNSVLTRLIVLTLISTFVVAVVLIGYASWLSLRIRRLSSAAETALDEQRLHSALPSALDGDEVGDLSRSFSSVLKQLGTYNDYLRTLASKLSHELRTPLTIVRSSLENLEHESLPDQALEYTARAMEGTNRLQRILNAMSEANRTEELIENAEPENFDLSEVLESTVAAYRDAWPERSFEYENRTTSSSMYGSPELIIQMLDKLADNAIDFTSPGDTIRISLGEKPGVLLISVNNPGPPLPDEMRAELFHSMVSVREGDAAGKHLGLGLYIARLIAVGHNGSISADNEDDGVTFTVHLATKHDTF